MLLWLPMQLGNLVVGTGAGLAVALVAGDLTVAVGVILAMGLKLVTERVVRREMADYLATRQRPGTSQTGAILRGGDVPSSGPSFPSGHVILVAAVGSVVAPDASGGVVVATRPCSPSLVMVGRVYVGAHNPLDVTAGLGAGLLLGGGPGGVRQLTADLEERRSRATATDVGSGWPDRCASISEAISSGSL